jgi:hypothetical protein
MPTQYAEQQNIRENFVQNLELRKNYKSSIKLKLSGIIQVFPIALSSSTKQYSKISELSAAMHCDDTASTFSKFKQCGCGTSSRKLSLSTISYKMPNLVFLFLLLSETLDK